MRHSPPQPAGRIIESRPQTGGSVLWPEVVAASWVSVTVDPCDVLRRPGRRWSRLGRWRRPVRPPPPRDRGRSRGALPRFTAALAAVEANTSGRSNPIASSTAPSTGCCRRSIRIRASSIRAAYAQMRERQEGRYYGLGITIQSIDGDITSGTCSKARRRTAAASAAATRSPRSTARAPKAGPASRPSAKLKGPKGTSVQDLDQAARVRRSDRVDRRARRGQHPEPCPARS